MTDEKSKNNIREIYRHDQMSNQVLNRDRRFEDRKTDIKTDAEMSNPKTLRGHVSLKDMGSGLNISKSTDEDKARILEELQDESILDGDQEVPERSPALPLMQNKSILELDDVPKLVYTPTDSSNRDTYSNLLTWCTDLLGSDVPEDIILGTTDLIISLIKEKITDTNAKDLKLVVEKELFTRLRDSDFNKLLKLVDSISDYKLVDNNKNVEDTTVPLVINDGGDIIDTNDSLKNPLLIDDSVPKDNNDYNEKIKNLENDKDSILIKGNKSYLPTDIPATQLTEEYLVNLFKTEIPNNDPYVLYSKVITSNTDTTNMIQNLIESVGDDVSSTLIQFIKHNGIKIKWAHEFYNSKGNETSVIERIKNSGQADIAEEFKLLINGSSRKRKSSEDKSEYDYPDSIPQKKQDTMIKFSTNDLKNLASAKISGNLSQNITITLPEGSFKRVRENLEEIHIPAPQKPVYESELINISDLPKWAQKAFPSKEVTTLNYIQSKVYHKAFHDDKNLLMCAPTGAGKTNVAVLTILQVLSQYINEDTDSLKLNDFRIVYVAPLKALVQEQVREFERRLSNFGIKVSELTGDTTLTRSEIEKFQVLVTTPEKWDVLTRKNDENDIMLKLKLLIIDEIHLLNDQRGPVLESLIMRAKENCRLRSNPRIIALSATLPNYEQVAKFLQVPEESIYYFDNSYRPCPLSQVFCGVKSTNSVKKLSFVNEVCFEKVCDAIKDGHQVIVFVHSRKETTRTAKFIADKFSSLEKNTLFFEENSRSILKSEGENSKDIDLKTLLPQGIGIHHAGLARDDRSLSEDLFADGVLRVLVSTATLAWGVNLPAHTVIIKGTDIYSPEVGNWIRLSPQDLLQMLGRAGRPRYDTSGEGIIITNQTDIQYYLAILNQQLPIESQFLSKFVDNLNAEISLGMVKTKLDAKRWIKDSYYYVRLCYDPSTYLPENFKEIDNDKRNSCFISGLIDAAIELLLSMSLIMIDKRNGTYIPTKLGRIASHYYISCNSVAKYFQRLKKTCSKSELFQIFSESEEFKYVSVKQEELIELKTLYDKSPIPVSVPLEEPSSKINLLLQAYISKIKLEGFALNADMIFVTQNAGRLLSAMKEICLVFGWSTTTKYLLELTKSVHYQMWPVCTPLRHFKTCPKDVIRRAESSSFPWQNYLKLTKASDVGKVIRNEKYGKLVLDLLQRYPKLEVSYICQPITPSLILIQLEILPDFVWDPKIHGFGEIFFVLVEDVSGSSILFSQKIVIKESDVGKEYVLSIPIQLSVSQQKRLPPNIFITVTSEKWNQFSKVLPIQLNNLKLPKKLPSKEIVNSIESLNLSKELPSDFVKALGFNSLNKIQSDVFNKVYHGTENLLVCSPPCTGKTTLALLATLSHIINTKGRIIYVVGNEKKLQSCYEKWMIFFKSINDSIKVGKLGGNLQDNLITFSHSHITLTSPQQVEVLTHRWRKLKLLLDVDLLVFDDIHELGQGLTGANYEIAVSRFNFIKTQADFNPRIMAFSNCLLNPSDIAGWIGVKKENTHNFATDEDQSYRVINIKAFENIFANDYTRSMLLYATSFVLSSQSTLVKNVLLVTTGKVGALRAANEMLALLKSNSKLHKISEITDFGIDQQDMEKSAQKYLSYGIGLCHEGMKHATISNIVNLFNAGVISVLISSRFTMNQNIKPSQIVVLGTSWHNCGESSPVHYSINEIMNLANLSYHHSSDVTILTDSNRLPLYNRFLNDGIPVESFLYEKLIDLLLTEVVIGTVKSRQDCLDILTFTYFYRRIHNNPSYYGLKDASSLSISGFLTEIVETAINDLSTSQLIKLVKGLSSDDIHNEIIEETTWSRISTIHGISAATLIGYIQYLDGKTTLTDMLHLLVKTSELSAIEFHEDTLSIVHKLAALVPLKFQGISKMEYSSYASFVLLQCHFSRISIPYELADHINKILLVIPQLLSSMIDILASQGLLSALTVMDMYQMVMQALWDIDSPLKQIPYFTNDIIKICKEKNIDSVYDIMELDDDVRDEILSFNDPELLNIASFVNTYPNIEIAHELDHKVVPMGSSQSITINIFRDDVPDSLETITPYYPAKHLEHWWIVLGDVSKQNVYAIKYVKLPSESNHFKLSFSLPERGTHKLTIWAICDSYFEADKESSFEIECV
ncbi:Pre-mRNA-splicing helicase BRR2 [Nakaseomyces glabratus]|nr:DEAD/DEAH box helicase [Nakaseomyces glabratus]KTB22521.1 Pre-mRNA-splicing helicase BRR2 [Nakaseomyces glabratus]KTB26578.1 Pre-mRNA-splicing helicase BRR2 [Nakaseomyces glabratus]QNG16644.1 uncharacterized protein GWK60_L15917 [Nakaseomyces glabratus]SCV13234.1 related to Pre-mRNA-splicing helicase BRR2 [Nakaseomyces glabratus]